MRIIFHLGVIPVKKKYMVLLGSENFRMRVSDFENRFLESDTPFELVFCLVMGKVAVFAATIRFDGFSR